jgi:PAS domain-containing protein
MRIALTLTYLAAVLASVLAAAALLGRRNVRAGIWLALLILAAGFAAAGDAVELQAFTVAGKRLISQIQYIGIVCMPPFYFHAAAALSRLEARLTRPVLVAVWLVPALTLVVAATSQWHGWLWLDITIPDAATNLGVYEYGWWFWVFVAHSYLLLAIATVLLLAATRRVTSPFRMPLAAVVIAVLLPWIGNVAYIAKLGPLPGANWFNLAILASAMILAWAATSQGLLDLVPRARQTLVDSMRDGVIVADRHGVIVYSNPAAHTLLGSLPADSRVPAVLLPEPAPAGAAPGPAQYSEIELHKDSATRWLEVRRDPVRDRWDEVAGDVFVIRDVTRRKTLERERERLIVELETALDEVSTLEGILPVCAACRKIRDDDDSWIALDDYVRRQARVEFTHGLCPDCINRLYPDYA